MQAQVPTDPYIALGTRLVSFKTDELAKLITNRRAVRMGLMCATVHLVTARDALAMRPVVASVYERVFLSARGDVGVPTFASRLSGVDLAALVRAGRKILDASPRTAAELRPILRERWPEVDGDALAAAVHFNLPLVQVPPRGVWGKGGRARHTSLEAWLGIKKSLGRDASPDALIVRYLRAFGPATVADARTWSRLNGLREAFASTVSSVRPGRPAGRTGPASLRIEPVAPLTKRDREAVAAEGERLLAFTDADAKARDVSVVRATKSTARSRRTRVATGKSRETVRRRTKKES